MREDYPPGMKFEGENMSRSKFTKLPGFPQRKSGKSKNKFHKNTLNLGTKIIFIQILVETNNYGYFFYIPTSFSIENFQIFKTDKLIFSKNCLSYKIYSLVLKS